MQRYAQRWKKSFATGRNSSYSGGGAFKAYERRRRENSTSAATPLDSARRHQSCSRRNNSSFDALEQLPDSEVIALKDSNSRPDAGIVTFEHRMFNQREEMVCVMERTALMQRRPG